MLPDAKQRHFPDELIPSVPRREFVCRRMRAGSTRSRSTPTGRRKGGLFGDGTSDVDWRQISTDAVAAFEMYTGSAEFITYGVGRAGWEIV